MLFRSGVYTLDRWQALQPTASKYSVQQVADAPAGFTYSLKVTSLSAYTPSSGDYHAIGQMVEGYNMADLAQGTSSAKTFTLSFWVKSSLTGSFGVLIKDNNTINYGSLYTINVANTWQYITITIPGYTGGSWSGSTTNSIGFKIWFDLGVGSTYQGTANSWVAGNYVAPTGGTKLISTNAATWQITGVQLEEGKVATPFEYRSYGQELALCQRYCYVISNSGNSPYDGYTMISLGHSVSTTNVYGMVTLPVTMRTPPTFSNLGSDASPLYWTDWTGASVTGLTINEMYGWDNTRGRIRLDKSAGYTAQRAGFIWFDGTKSNQRIAFNAEL